MKTLKKFLEENRNINEGRNDLSNFELFDQWAKKNTNIMKQIGKVLKDITSGKIKIDTADFSKYFEIPKKFQLNPNGWHVTHTSGSVNYDKNFRDEFYVQLKQLYMLKDKEDGTNEEVVCYVSITFIDGKIKKAEVKLSY